ncbi:MAG: flagellar hook-length control protein FliK [Pseudomonadota bacterium]
MEISFLKSLVMPAADKSAATSAIGTVPAFVDSMLKSDTRIGEQAPGDETVTGGNAPAQAAASEMETPEASRTSGEAMPFSALSGPAMTLRSGYAFVTLSQSDGRESEIPELPSADEGTVKLADIDPQSPIMPYRTMGLTGGETSDPVSADPSGKPAAKATEADPAILTQKLEADRPKNLARVNNMPVEDGQVAATARNEQLPVSTKGAEQYPVSGLQALTVPQNMPADRGSHQIIDPVTDAERSTDDAAMEKLAPSLELKKLLNPSPQMENTKQSMPLATSANGKPEKLADDLNPAEILDPEAVEIKNSASNAAQAPPVNPLAGLRLRQSPTAETASGLQVDTMRALSPSSNSAKAADAAAQASTLATDAVLEFDSAFIANLTREISLIANSKGTARFSLKPEHLGRIDVEIRGGERGDDIKLVAETESVKQFLIQSQSRLEQEIRLHGQKLTSLDIGTGLDQGPERQASESQQAENFRTRTNGGSDDEQAEPQYYAGTASGQTTNGARYA